MKQIDYIIRKFKVAGQVIDVIGEVSQYESAEDRWIVGTYTAGTGIASSVASTAATWGTAKIFAAVGTTVAPGLGTLIGLGVGLLVGYGATKLFDWIQDEYIDDIVENN